MFGIKSETQEFTKKLKQRFCRIEYNDESLVKNKSSINVNTVIPELSNISNILEQIEPTIDDINYNLTKHERKALKKLQEYQNLVIRKADIGNILIRSSPPEVFWGKNALKICSKFTGEHPCRSAIY